MILITGGARSGKSRYAETLCKDFNNKVCYIATAKAIDKDMEDRIQRHRDQRPASWYTIEQYRDFDTIVDREEFTACDTFLLDCVTIMLTNIMFDQDVDYEHCSMDTVEEIEQQIFDEIRKLIKVMSDHQKTLILVTNEVGSGLVPAYRLGSIFRDIAGRVNQYLASEASEVTCVISGLPLRLK